MTGISFLVLLNIKKQYFTLLWLLPLDDFIKLPFKVLQQNKKTMGCNWNLIGRFVTRLWVTISSMAPIY